MTSHSNSIVPADPTHYPDSLLCPICWAVPTPLVVTTCDHAFCAPCLQTSMEHREQCPQCRKRCSNGAQQSSKTRNALVFRIWSRLAVKCEQPGCGWAGTAEDGARHVTQRHRGVVAGVGEAREPPPSTTTTIHNSNDGPDQIVIENATVPRVNGTYSQHGYFQEACMYRKRGSGDDDDNSVLIFRHDRCRWRIAVAPARGNQICYYETCVDPVNPAWPPRTGWWGYNDQEQALTLLFLRHDGTCFVDDDGAKDENDNESDTGFSAYTIEYDDGDNDNDDDLEESSMGTEDSMGFGSDNDFDGEGIE